jgi:glucose-6-phosphate isomerase
MAYLNRQSDKDFVELRSLISNKIRKPVTFGWGPRFLHSTGQFHKGGPLIGAFLQITADCEREVAIPGVNYDFQELLMAQAKGDYAALSSRDLPVLRINLKNKVQGLEKIKRALS